MLDRLDLDKDGKLTRAEFDAGMNRARRRSEPSPTPRVPAPPGGAPESPRRIVPDQPGEPPRSAQSPVAGRPGGPAFGGPDLFRALDTDNDGKLSKAELARAVETLMKYDKNGDGSLSPDEIAEGVRGSPPVVQRPPGAPPTGEGVGRTLEAIIQRADKNGDGKLSRDEVPDMLRARFDEIDTNKDGLVDKAELAAIGERLRRLRDAGGTPPGFPGRPGSGIAPGRPGGGAINDGNRERVAGFLRQYDRDADGRISSKEFGEERREEFKRLDADGDGYLTPDELARGLPPRGDPQDGGRRRPEPTEPKKSDSDKP